MSEYRGLEPAGPPSWSVVNLLFPLQVGGESPAAMFALAHWLLPRVPTIGEEIDVDAIGYRVKVEGVRWEIRGRAVVRLQEAYVDPANLAALEAEGWTVARWEDEPPKRLAHWAS
jgi:hypothetical protein